MAQVCNGVFDSADRQVHAVVVMVVMKVMVMVVVMVVVMMVVVMMVMMVVTFQLDASRSPVVVPRVTAPPSDNIRFVEVWRYLDIM